jgi:hypothetical protein
MTRRALHLCSLLAACAGATACTAPGPTPPAQGVFGSVVDDRGEGSQPLVGRVVYAASPTHTEGMPTAGLSFATVDEDGHFVLELAPGRLRLCLAEGGALAHCDCITEVTPAGQVHRAYSVWFTPWVGNWTQGGLADSDVCVVDR